MPIRFGSTSITRIYRGSSPIARAYAGADLIFSGDELDLFVFAGQSNMDSGTGANPRYGTPDPNIKIWVDGDWETYEPLVNASHAFPEAAWGPEAEFAYQWRQANPTRTFYMVKQATGATSLGVNWEQSEGEQWAALEAKYAAALANLEAIDTTRTRAFVWMQGELDAANETLANAYETNLTTLFASVRTLMGSSVKIVVGRISDQPATGYPFRGTVRAAQLAVVRATSNASIISTDTIPLQEDSPHFTTPDGFQQLGLYFYQSFANIYDDVPYNFTLTWAGAYTGGVIPANTAVGTTLASLAAQPGDDVGGAVTFSEVSDPASVFTVNGGFKLDASVVDEGTYPFTVRATNSLGRFVDLSSTATGAPAGGFTSPADFGSALVYWLRAEDETVIRSGTDVTEWRDKSGNNRHFSPTSTPQYNATGSNGTLPAIELLPGQYFTRNLPLSCEKFAVFAVASMSDGNVIFATLVSYDDDNSSPDNHLLLSGDSSNTSIISYRGAVLGSRSITQNTLLRMASVFDGTNHNIYINNVAGTPAAHSTAIGAAGSSARMLIGINPAGTRGWLYEPISEIFFLDLDDRGPLTSEELQAIDDYFVTQWDF
jgi:hypothetical protein